MVRVYRKDLGFGEGTDGQNYYEVSEERAKEKMAIDKVINICRDCEISKREKELMEEYI